MAGLEERRPTTGAFRREPPQDFLRGQMREWLEQVQENGRTRDLFELEMWLRSFERFFRVKNQPLSEKETRQLALRSWSEELRLVDNILLRTVQLCTAILTEEQVNQARFGQYVETYLKKDDVKDPYVEKLLRQSTPEAALTLLAESLEDLHQLLRDMVKLSRLPFASFNAVGKILYREIRRSHLLAMLLDKKFKPVHDHIRIPAIAAAIRAIENPVQRRQAAKVFLEFFRLMATGSAPFSVTEGGGGAERAQVICGFLGCDVRPFNPVIEALPRVRRMPRARSRPRRGPTPPSSARSRLDRFAAP